MNETRNKTLPCFDLPHIELTKTYAPGKWTIQEILVHLSDAEAMLCSRIKRVIAEPKQVIWAFNQDLFCKNLNYSFFPLGISKNLYQANRDVIIFLAENYYATCGNNQFVHSETGLRTLKDEFEKVVTHNQSHVKQIEIALASL